MNKHQNHCYMINQVKLKMYFFYDIEKIRVKKLIN